MSKESEFLELVRRTMNRMNGPGLIHQFIQSVTEAYNAWYAEGAALKGEPIIYFNRISKTFGWCSDLDSLAPDCVEVFRLSENKVLSRAPRNTSDSELNFYSCGFEIMSAISEGQLDLITRAGLDEDEPMFDGIRLQDFTLAWKRDSEFLVDAGHFHKTGENTECDFGFFTQAGSDAKIPAVVFPDGAVALPFIWGAASWGASSNAAARIEARGKIYTLPEDYTAWANDGLNVPDGEWKGDEEWLYQIDWFGLDGHPAPVVEGLPRLAPHYLTAIQAAEFLGMTPSGVRRLIGRGKLPAQKILGHLVVKRTDLNKIVKSKAGRPKKSKED